jgi:thymidylate synthase
MKVYNDLLKKVLSQGVKTEDRTGVGTISIFGEQMKFNLGEGFPAITTKKLAFNSVKAELLWFLKGTSNIKILQEMGCNIWNANYNADYWIKKAKFDGDLGRVYGVQWRSWRGIDGKSIDQLKQVIEKIKSNPNDRRLVVTAWNPAELDQMALPPCHILFQFYVKDGRISLQMYQRSADMFLGVPFNIASYALLLSMVAHVTGLIPHQFIHVLGDTHIYLNHIEQVNLQLERSEYPLPKLWLNSDVRDIDDFKMEDIMLLDYHHHPAIKAPMAV